MVIFYVANWKRLPNATPLWRSSTYQKDLILGSQGGAEWSECCYKKNICEVVRYIWVNYSISLTWIKAMNGDDFPYWPWFQWGRSEVVIIYPDISTKNPIVVGFINNWANQLTEPNMILRYCKAPKDGIPTDPNRTKYRISSFFFQSYTKFLHTKYAI